MPSLRVGGQLSLNNTSVLLKQKQVYSVRYVIVLELNIFYCKPTNVGRKLILQYWQVTYKAMFKHCLHFKKEHVIKLNKYVF